MVKKSKDAIPNPNSVVNRDIIQRLNFLYQGSVYLNAIADTVPPSSPNPRKKKQNKRITVDELSRDYISTMRIIGQKTTVKMDPAVKRTLCQVCDSVLVAGSNTIVRVKKSPSHKHTMIYTCTHCKGARRIPAPPESIPPDSTSKSFMIVDTDNPSVKMGRPPLPLRDEGHVVFIGQEQIVGNPLLGSGLFTV